jgi:hypothetical protein
MGVAFAQHFRSIDRRLRNDVAVRLQRALRGIAGRRAPKAALAEEM